MACDIDTIKTDSCESGIGRLDNPIALLQVIAQLLCELNEE